jgi:hypothetical protein
MLLFFLLKTKDAKYAPCPLKQLCWPLTSLMSLSAQASPELISWTFLADRTSKSKDRRTLDSLPRRPHLPLADQGAAPLQTELMFN